MFLAWNEIKNNKLRFALVVGVLTLVSYLVFFLSGLANGLENLNKEAVIKWEADGIVLTEESDMNLTQSSFDSASFDVGGVDEFAVLGQFSSIATSGDKKASISIFGIDQDEFIMPNIMEGEAFASLGEVVADDSLKEEGFKIGDEMTLASSDQQLKIVGFTEDARFNSAPVVYGSLETFHSAKFGDRAEEMGGEINGIVVRTADLDGIELDESLQVTGTETFIENLPGYSEQSLTLTFMIYFLFIISAVILAIFLYVLTIQKISIFGVMKAQGISNGFLSKSVLAQTFILALAGVIVGLGLTVLTGQFLPAAVPVAFAYIDMAIYGVILVAVSIIGALFSVQTIVKIDPLEAIGG